MLLLGSILNGLSAQAAGFYKIPQKDPIIQTFLDQIEDRLPARLKSVFPNGLNVKFEKLGSHGRYDKKNNTILLSSELVEVIYRGEAASKPSLDKESKIRSHKTEYKETQASVVHETAHAYDFLDVHSQRERAFIDNCKRMAANKETYQPDGCDIYLRTRTTFSSDPYYLELAGWPLSPKGEGLRESENTFTPRTADPYEFANPSEHFAVNFEYYILDPEFSCRKPSLAHFLNAHFQFRPFSAKCAPLTYVNPSANSIDMVLKNLPLDRVYQIHYLHADKGQDMASRWGHSMFRLIICAPETKMGPDCMNDEYNHLVLSFRAFVGVNGLNSWKTLIGEYSTRLFVIPFVEVKNSYISGELRDLVSYPLVLSESEKKRFLERSIESHWNYSSKYYLLSNNCAVESLNLLRSSLLRPELMDKKLIKPTELRDLLFHLKMVDTHFFSQDRSENAKRGLFFDNHADRYAKYYSAITGKVESVEAVLKHVNSPFVDRQKVYTDEVKSDLKKMAALIILETAAVERFQSSIKTSLLEKSIKLSEDALKSTLEKSLELFNLFSAPYEFLSKETYGIPNAEELRESVVKVQQTWTEKSGNYIEKTALFSLLFSSSQKEEIKKTKDFLDQSINSLQNLLKRQELRQ